MIRYESTESWKRSRQCKNCGGSGHYQKTCPLRFGASAAAVQEFDGENGPRKVPVAPPPGPNGSNGSKKRIDLLGAAAATSDNAADANGADNVGAQGEPKKRRRAKKRETPNIPWDEHEIAQFKWMVEEEGPSNWESKAQRLGTGRTKKALHTRWMRDQGRIVDSTAASAAAQSAMRQQQQVKADQRWSAELTGSEWGQLTGPGPTGTSVFVGVCRDKRDDKWKARWHDGTHNNFGYFDSEQEAATAFDEAARRLRPQGQAHGGWSNGQHGWAKGQNWLRLNFPTAAEKAYAAQQGMPSADFLSGTDLGNR